MKKLLIVCIVLIFASPVLAKLPASCGKRMEGKITRYINDIKDVMNAPSRDARNKAKRIQSKKDELERYINGSWVQQCVAEHPESMAILQRLKDNEIKGVYAQVDSSKAGLCQSAGMKFLKELTGKIQKGVQEGNLKGVERSYEIMATHGALKNCPPLEPQLKALASQKNAVIARTRQVAALKKLGGSYSYTYAMNEGVKKAMAEKTSITRLTGSQSQRDYKDAVVVCDKQAQFLLSSGYKAENPAVKYKGTVVTLKDAAAFCGSAAKEADSLIAKIEKYNSDFEKNFRKDWENKNLRGDAMKKVYLAENKHLPKIKDIGEQVLWQYKSKQSKAYWATCTDYAFDKNGSRVIKHESYTCEW